MVARSLGTHCLPWNEDNVPMSYFEGPLGTTSLISPKSHKHRKTHSPPAFALGLKMEIEMEARLQLLSNHGE